MRENVIIINIDMWIDQHYGEASTDWVHIIYVCVVCVENMPQWNRLIIGVGF